MLSEFPFLRDGGTTIKIKFAVLRGGGGGIGGREENRPKCCFFFCGKRHDNRFLKLEILLSRNFVVIARRLLFSLQIDSAFEFWRFKFSVVWVWSEFPQFMGMGVVPAPSTKIKEEHVLCGMVETVVRSSQNRSSDRCPHSPPAATANLKFSNVVVLNAVGGGKAWKSTKQRKWSHKTSGNTSMLGVQSNSLDIMCFQVCRVNPTGLSYGLFFGTELLIWYSTAFFPRTRHVPSTNCEERREVLIEIVLIVSHSPRGTLAPWGSWKTFGPVAQGWKTDPCSTFERGGQSRKTDTGKTRERERERDQGGERESQKNKHRQRQTESERARERERDIYICICVCFVKLLSGPSLGVSGVIIWSK